MLEPGAWLWAPLARQLLLDAEAPAFGQIDGLADFLATTGGAEAEPARNDVNVEGQRSEDPRA
jgi:hypothetical protein